VLVESILRIQEVDKDSLTTPLVEVQDEDNVEEDIDGVDAIN